jgi:ATP adenylyltransferase
MNNLFCPWRSDYSLSTNNTNTDTSEKGCVFCTQPKEHNDAYYYILHRAQHAYVMLNRYPYNAGHLLIIPFEHKASLEDYSTETQEELMRLCTLSCTILKRELKAEGINVGINMGRAAGAGMPNHLHMHVLPRWTGDTNFMPVLTGTKQISFDLREIYEELLPHF